MWFQLSSATQPCATQDGPWYVQIRLRGPDKVVRVTADLEGKPKRKIATPEAHVSPCKSLRRSNAFLEESHVSQETNFANIPGGHMCHGEWVTDSQVHPNWFDFLGTQHDDHDEEVHQTPDEQVPETLPRDDDIPETLVVD